MSISLQKQVKVNVHELNCVLRVLDDWTGYVREQDRALFQQRKGAALCRSDLKKVSIMTHPAPPVRGRIKSHTVKSEEELTRDIVVHQKATSVRKASLSRGAKEHLLGNARFKERNFSSAVRHYSRCIAMGTKTTAALTNRALCGIKLKRWSDVEADCTQVLVRKPLCLKVNNTFIFMSATDLVYQARHCRGVARRELCKLLDSVADFEKSILLEPGNRTLLHELGRSKSAYKSFRDISPTQLRIDLVVNIITPE